jgi:hypothetical protein
MFSENQSALLVKVVIFGLAGKRDFVFAGFWHLFRLE